MKKIIPATRVIAGTIVSAIFSALVYSFLVYVEAYFLYENYEVQPSGKMKLDEWISNFNETALLTTILAFIGVLFWYAASYFWYRISAWQRTDSFWVWLSIWALIVIALFVYGYYYTDKTDNLGRFFASCFYAFNGGLIYWLSTAIFSPSTVKYAPLGSIRLRMALVGNRLLKRS